jgi:sugar/nucleoside kinase (ribokinase family)
MPIPLVDFAGIGENATDIVLRLRQFPTRDGKTDTISREMRLGGQVATAVFAAAKWGLRTRYVGAIGSDTGGALHLQELRNAGVDTQLQRFPDAESRLSYILVEDPTGSRAVLCHRDPRVQLKPGFLKKAWFQRARLVHVDGENPEASRMAASWAREAGAKVMCDLDQYREELRFVLPQIDYPVLSLGVLEELGDSNDPLSALPVIRARYGCKWVSATLGEQGALAWDGARFFYAPAYRINVVDTTGAGDLFHAGFAYGLLQGWDVQKILAFGCAAAGLNCAAPGARGGIGTVRQIAKLGKTGSRHPGLYSEGALSRAAKLGRAARA